MKNKFRILIFDNIDIWKIKNKKNRNIMDLFFLLYI